MRNTLLIGSIASAVFVAAADAAEPHPRDLEEVVVTAAPIATDTRSMAQPASVLSGDALTLVLAPTIGETVAREPGVNSTFFGPAASRPVIRGLSGDRVQVLTDGLATLDASGVSDDHAVAIDPALADQVEVLRGPSTLLYGSGAAGGLVNVVTNRLHEHGLEGVSGLVEMRGDTALGERAVAGRIDGGGESFVLHVDGVWRDTDDFEVPDEAGGEVTNSWSETRSGGAGASWIGDAATLGAALSRHDTEYGVPGEDVLIDLKQDRLDVAARFDFATERELTLRLRGAANDYEHAEIEPGGEIGTMFEVDGRELRAALDGALPGGIDATAGLQWQQIELAAIGEEAFVPASRTRATGIFAFGRGPVGAGSLELGLRADRQEIETAVLPDYSGNAINGSLGLTWPLSETLDLIGQLVRSERHPGASELYADGPHAATQQFEIGDPDLTTERGWTAELGLRRTAGAAVLDLRAFASRYDSYIFLSPTGAVEDGLPVFQFLQQDARFEGFKAQLALPLAFDGGLMLTLMSDYVRGRLDQGGDLPRVPPLRVGAELAWDGDAFGAELGVQHVFEQDDVAALETTTGAYTLLDAGLTWRLDWAGPDALVFLKATNLLDEVARVHTSPLKDTVPLPGRSFGVGLRIAFGGEGR
ncbi:MAG: TonB-dependent receptor [Steroidobacteraceae bacterium]